MPETAINHDNDLGRWKNDVSGSPDVRQRTHAHPISEPKPPQGTSKGYFRFCVTTANFRHAGTDHSADTLIIRNPRLGRHACESLSQVDKSARTASIHWPSPNWISNSGWPSAVSPQEFATK